MRDPVTFNRGSLAEGKPARAIFFKVLGVRVDAVQIPEVVLQIERWIEARTVSRFISVANTHVVIEAQRAAFFNEIINLADLCVPDGMPLVWVGRLRGYRLKRRVYGPELMLAFCESSARKGFAHFFYGGTSSVGQQLARTMQERFPGLRVAGVSSPPFRTLTAAENEEAIDRINQAKPDVLWVGLGCPKQERWMYDHRERLKVPVMLGVGQAFDIFAGRVHQAPRWMREHGFEWLFRLLQEPRRLWRRYLIYNTQFIYYLFLEVLGMKNFDSM